MIKNLFFDALFALFVIILLVSGVFFVRPAMSSTGMPPVRAAAQGTWPPDFSAMPVYDFSRDLWGQVASAFFHRERNGLLLGNDAWLFANDRFACPADAAQNIDANLDYITATRNLLAERNTTLLVVLIPAKGRLLSGHAGASRMPSCRRHVYDKALDYMDRHRIAAADLLAALRGAPGTVDALKMHNGDVLEQAQNLSAENPLPLTQVADAGTTLTDNTRAAGSAFEGFLKAALRMNLLPVAEQGQGPFAVMGSYLRDAAWTSNPPGLVVWEIPERYLIMKRGATRL